MRKKMLPACAALIPGLGTLTAQDAAADQARLVSALNSFSSRLYSEAAGQDNFCCSPTSISTVLLLALAGARDETRREMAVALYLETEGGEPQWTSARLHHAAASLLADLTAPDEKRELRVANDLWGQDGYPFAGDYLELLNKAYGAGLHPVPFVSDAEKARATINDAIAKQTRGKIRDLIPAGVLSPDTRLVLTNAVYFKAAWLEQFDADFTKALPFTLRSGERVQVPTMHNWDSYGYWADDDLQVLRMRYADRRYCMEILLPGKGKELAVARAALAPERLARWTDALKTTYVKLQVPRFKVTSAMSLRDALVALGMNRAFDATRADFSGMNDGEDPLFIDEALHKTFIVVDENGTEAAAATALVMVVGAAAEPQEPVGFHADRPFLFTIRDARSGLLLFVGQVTDPRQTDQ